MRKYELLIFITGAVTLSLEVLTSRVMTPYFGVSLYIWTGILSITLTFLAVGYGLGGRLSATRTRDRLERDYLIAPLLSAAAIVAAVLVYPVLFPLLSNTNLILGSFIGATLLLALPLITLSAMNPLLIGLQRHAAATGHGDAGAGRVFFISTVGSVAGVLATAFLFIPSLSNFHSVLTLALVLCGLSAVYTGMSKAITGNLRRAVLAGCAVTSVAGGLLIGLKDDYLQRFAAGPPSSLVFAVEAEYRSVFGNIKVLKVGGAAAGAPMQRVLIQDGLVQNRATMRNTSISEYTYALWALTKAAVPEAKSALVLGIGAGIVPRHLRDSGIRVAAVDLNADMLEAAIGHFGFDPAGIGVFIQDARTFVSRCDGGYDVVVVDLFLGDNVPDYLLTREFFAAARACLNDGGALVMNTFLDTADDLPNRRFLATLRAAFPRVATFTIPAGNTLIVAGENGMRMASADATAAALPASMGAFVRAMLAAAAPVTTKRIAGAQPVSDDHNVFGALFAEANMRERQKLATQLPPWVLVN